MSVLEKLRLSSNSDMDYDDDSPTESLSDLGEGFGEEFQGDDRHRDPVPGEPPPAPKKTRARKAVTSTDHTGAPRVTAKHRAEAQEEVESFLQFLALTWGFQAPPCGAALEEAAPDVAAKFTKLIARNPRWLMRVREGGVITDALSVAMSLAPVFKAAWAYYSVPQGGDEGGVTFDPASFPPYSG